MSHNIKSNVTLQNGQYILFHTFLQSKNEGARFHFVEKLVIMKTLNQPYTDCIENLLKVVELV